jgi:hypothetical protein
LVEEFLAQTSRPADEVVAAMPHLGRECTVELAAVNAALAGCRPEYFPVVLAAWEALGRERAVVGGGWQSTSGPAPLIVVNGAIRQRLGINSTGGVLGPLLRTCEFVDNRTTRDPRELLTDFADTISRTGAAIPPFSTGGLILGVEHAQTLAAGGFTKRDVQQWLYERCVRSHDDLTRAGKGLWGRTGPGVNEHGLHMLPSPEQLMIVVAGARNAAMSMVVRPFGFAGWSRSGVAIERR